MAKDSCLSRMVAGASVGGAVGCAVGSLFHLPSAFTSVMFAFVVFPYLGVMYGSFEAIRCKVPGVEKIRFVGQRTVGTAALFGVFLSAGSLIHCGKSY